MASVHNAIKYATGPLEALAIASGVSRDQSGTERVSETLHPSIDIWSLPEWAFLRSERLGAGRLFAAAVGGEFGIIALGNALGSNAIVVVEAVSANCGANTVQLEVAADGPTIAATLSAAANFISARDRRWLATTGRVFGRTGTDPASTFGAQIEHQASTATLYVDFKSLPIVLKPGDDVLVICQVVNVALDVNFRWRERQAQPGELPAV